VLLAFAIQPLLEGRQVERLVGQPNQAVQCAMGALDLRLVGRRVRPNELMLHAQAGQPQPQVTRIAVGRRCGQISFTVGLDRIRQRFPAGEGTADDTPQLFPAEPTATLSATHIKGLRGQDRGPHRIADRRDAGAMAPS